MLLIVLFILIYFLLIWCKSYNYNNSSINSLKFLSLCFLSLLLHIFKYAQLSRIFKKKISPPFNAHTPLITTSFSCFSPYSHISGSLNTYTIPSPVFFLSPLWFISNSPRRSSELHMKKSSKCHVKVNGHFSVFLLH